MDPNIQNTQEPQICLSSENHGSKGLGAGEADPFKDSQGRWPSAGLVSSLHPAREVEAKSREMQLKKAITGGWGSQQRLHRGADF